MNTNQNTDEMIPLNIKDTFQFNCGPDVPCFNACCQDLHQTIMPYDVLRLKNNLGLSSGEFLKRYTIRHTGPGSGLPVVTLKTMSAKDLRCIFVTKEGCSVYKDRPASCRIYPLARAVSRSRETGELQEYYALIQEPHCQGFEQKNKQTIGEWLKNQEIEDYNKMNDLLMEIIALKNAKLPGPLDFISQNLFYMASYDLDAFRDHVFNKKLWELYKISPETLEALKTDDTELLKFGMKWIKQVIFNENGLKKKS
ncbi:YkgJ family cysteine cluster protein [Candidatus Magnetomoraceae bacterium gMMP-15]